MKTTLSLNTDIQLTFNQLKDLAKQLPEKQRRELATILVNEDENITKKQLVAKIKEGLEEVKLYKEGKVTLQSAREFLNEL
ncbi:hypothetical protein L0657_20520 [Dyadobacter sp. CY345]|uniref:hypothetical protein n=1 Tax=Dyadobacter sp. CY345 TaxID=2909335 RepID=UPI001F37C266|nr:hypothetical protein [Dyadobacter sp. CY345]MCF2446355.1 hypothetical protein [Dyadobacter sp. CY345]